MTYFTTKEISDLNNSMVAAQNMQLGTVVDELTNALISGSSVYKVTSGSFTPVTGITPVATGLSSVIGVTCSMGGTPTTRHVLSTVTTGSVAGTIWVSCWEGTASGSVITLTLSSGSASAHFAPVGWMARGL